MKNTTSLTANLTNLYPISKTLRFALNPVGKTSEMIKQKGLIAIDEERAKKYKQAKLIIDEYHKYHINQVLSCFKFNLEDLQRFADVYNSLKKDNKNEALKTQLSNIQTILRKQVAQALENKGKQIANALDTKRLFSKEFIKEDLPKWLDENQDAIKIEGITNPKSIIAEFSNWVSYLGGYNKNRENIYADAAISTSIGYRLIHENLPKFINNLGRFQKACDLGVDFSEITKNLAVDLGNVFTLKYFNNCLTQTGINEYNLVRGGRSKADNKKQQGINESINLRSQALQSQKSAASDEDKKDLNLKIKQLGSCQLEELFKQILSDRESLSFKLDEIKNDAQLCNFLQMFSLDSNDNLIIKTATTNPDSGEVLEKQLNLTSVIKTSIANIQHADEDQLYISNNASITSISQFIFGDWNLIKQGLEIYAKNLFPKTTKTEEKKRASWLKNTSYFSFAEIHKGLELYFKTFTDNELDDSDSNEGVTTKKKNLALDKPLIKYFSSLEQEYADETETYSKKNIFDEIITASPPALAIIKKYSEVEKEELKSQHEDILPIKTYLDAIKKLQEFLKPLYIVERKKNKKSADAYTKDAAFYNDFDETYQLLADKIIPLYNQTRNYLTKKASSIEKFKLNFENVTLAAGWDKNKEESNTAVILLKNDKYYLGIMDKKNNKLFHDLPPTATQEIYHKMKYKLLPSASKMLPKVFFSGKNIGYYNPSNKVLEIRNHASHTKRGTPQEGYDKKDFNLQDCHAIIDFFKASLAKHPEWGSTFNFKFSPTSSYQDTSEFYNEVEKQGYNISYENVDASYINKQVDEGKLYLFQIYSKDFSEKSTGRPNLNTIYWRALFDPKNLENVIYKLNGEAELFFRPASIKYSDEIWKNGHHADCPKKNQPFPIIKDRRYAQDKFLFHVPITMNFGASDMAKFNDKVNSILKNNPDINALSIDRGERNLIYVTLINQQGEILEQINFNLVNGVDYHALLTKIAKNRAKARKSWDNMQKDKDIKAGYLSQVVHQICRMLVEHNAIIIMEDLSFGFKKGRFKVEIQIYQKFEKMLIDKLNYLILKDKDDSEVGGIYKALQLTAPFTSFKELGKQTGIIFYVPAYHTSKICPATGFVNLLYPKYETIKKSQEFFSKFEQICYNKKEDCFEFHIKKYTDFNAKAHGCKQSWVIYSQGLRLTNFRDAKKNNDWTTEDFEPTKEIKKILQKSGIAYDSGACIKQEIVKQDKSSFFKDMIRGLQLTLQMRNTKNEKGSNEDWMISPVKNEKGEFFDSRKVTDNSMPENADANGAYHIGLKGLWVLRQINNWTAGSKLNLAISNEKWYEFAQNKAYKN